MTHPTIRDPADVVFFPEPPPGATAQQYRTGAHELPCFVLRSGTLAVDLLDDPHRVRFTFECLVQPAGVPGTADEFVAEEWTYDIPAVEGEVSGVHAWDTAGTLETTLEPAEARATRLRVRFRRRLGAGGQYRFGYAYEARGGTAVTAGIFKRTVVCTGWLIFNLPCEVIRVCIRLPPHARLMSSTPPGTVTDASPGRTQVHYDLERLRALEVSQWMVGYRQRKVGLPLWLWIVSQLGAGLVGWLIGRAMDGWLAHG
ncbi:hypothetical protein [Longimicrobium sp.]|uniref:hypothetical protein n=1 Tax=Longimicrobium sp. TaxID=2029185 RepID=UPI002E310161|nr:hypothetical protein [Longimicrobium sp.]HEX6038643.1 hypothetical protein [Longimicrobium sp.]